MASPLSIESCAWMGGWVVGLNGKTG